MPPATIKMTPLTFHAFQSINISSPSPLKSAYEYQFLSPPPLPMIHFIYPFFLQVVYFFLYLFFSFLLLFITLFGKKLQGLFVYWLWCHSHTQAENLLSPLLPNPTMSSSHVQFTSDSQMMEGSTRAAVKLHFFQMTEKQLRTKMKRRQNYKESLTSKDFCNSF